MTFLIESLIACALFMLFVFLMSRIPNPASERVQVTSSFGLLHIELYNAAGSLIYQHSFLRDGALPLPANLAPGMYILRAQDRNQTATARIIVTP